MAGVRAMVLKFGGHVAMVQTSTPYGQ